MSKIIRVNLEELKAQGILTEETASSIEAYYESRKTSSSSRLTLAFGILGAVLTGLGIILIVAHNWDNFSRATKTIFAFLPMLVGQAAVGYALMKKTESASWREGSGAFLFFTVGACMAMVSQIYNIQGSLSSYLLTWMLLCLPLIYVLRSSIVSLLYIGGITWYACEAGYWTRPVSEPYLYWGLLLLVIPYYLHLYRNRPASNSFNFHSWGLAISVLITLGLWASKAGVLLWVSYVGLLGVYFLLGDRFIFKFKQLFNNPFRVIGALGLIILFLIGSFEDFWQELHYDRSTLSMLWKSPEIYITLLLVGIGVFLLLKKERKDTATQLNPLSIAFLVYPLTFVIGFYSSIAAAVLINILLLLAGVFYIKKGSDQEHLGFLNLGLLIITALIVCRFFDADISFVLRGILFVLLGIGFFFANYRILKNRKE